VANKSLRFQNLLLLGASYYFYSSWDYRFLFLLIFSTLLDYFSGIKIQEADSSSKRKMWLWISIVINLGFLGVFKYYNFFIASAADALSVFGFTVNSWSLNIILPVGISFYTFHGLSYVIDIYNNRIKAERNFVDYALFVSFFPLLVAGPIERATHLLPQLKKPRSFDHASAVEGLRQILWGLFKKIVIADNCATFANQIFNGSEQYGGSTLFLGALFFTFQIYCDFSGYSDIALGTARLFGIGLLRNFAFPYFSRDIAEFWRRWHISLSSWFRDYVYIPLGGSKGGAWMKIRNTFVIFLISGFWHGANWTFIVWGLLNAIYFLPLLLAGSNRTNLDIVAAGRVLPSLKETLQIGITFLLTVIAWIFFRSESLTHAWTILAEIISPSILSLPEVTDRAYLVLVLVFMFLCIEWLGRDREFAISGMFNIKYGMIRWANYMLLILIIFLFGVFSVDLEFIYFQF
jgi:D-alanyl-lipoteichoic acid acyltransferase DltB (MBOAT superfamily)